MVAQLSVDFAHQGGFARAELAVDERAAFTVTHDFADHCQRFLVSGCEIEKTLIGFGGVGWFLEAKFLQIRWFV